MWLLRDTQAEEASLRPLGWWVALATSSVFLMASIGKYWTGILDLQACIQIAGEAMLAVVASAMWRKRFVQLSFILVFGAFAVYVLADHFLTGSSSCECFGAKLHLPSWAMFSLDLSFAYAWSEVFAKSSRKLRSLLKIVLVGSLSFAITYEVDVTVARIAARQMVRNHLASFTEKQMKVINESSAIYFLITRCDSCVKNLPAFEAFCEENGHAGIVAIGENALEVSNVRCPIVKFPVPEERFRSVSRAHYIRDGKFAGEILLD